MGNVIELRNRAAAVRRSAADRGRANSELGSKIDQVVEAIDKQKAEIALFRQRMERLRTEMMSLDKNVEMYRRRIDSIPHKTLHRQARSLAAIMTERASQLS